MTIEFAVVGEPVPQGSKKAFVNKKTGRGQVVDDNKKTLRDWRNDIRVKATDWCEDRGLPEPLDCPVKVSIEFYLTKPKSAPRWKLWAHTKPDLDKLVRAALDAVTAVLIRDDARVVELVASKEYAIGRPPGMHMVIEAVPKEIEVVEAAERVAS